MISTGTQLSEITELWALRDSLDLAKDLNISNLIVELYDLSLVHFFHNSAENKALETLFSNCRIQLTKFQNRRIVHIYWEGNRCADALGKAIDVYNPPLMVETLLPLDAKGNACNRLICI